MKQQYGIALRVNSFLLPGSSETAESRLISALKKMGGIAGVTHIEPNFPDHVTSFLPKRMASLVNSMGKTIGGFGMRYGQEFTSGAFTNPDKKIRTRAIDLTKEGMDALNGVGGSVLTVWPGPDGFDMPFECRFEQRYTWFVEGIKKAAVHNPDIRISLEYKPSHPRAHGILPSMAATLLAVSDIDEPNVGVTIDVCHSLCARESPAAVASLALSRGKLFGVHLNDGYGREDDGLPVGSIHMVETTELFDALLRLNYGGYLYFDTFPRTDPVAEAKKNIKTVRSVLSGFK